MSKGKWGESFLKSGLPLEHLTVITFKSLGWYCTPHYEYARYNRNGEEAWFEIDLVVTSPETNNDTDLVFLVECKYHDLSRFWFFLPHEPERWAFNDRITNCGPLQTLREPRLNSLLSLAPCSAGGIVVSADGSKQDNAIHTAIQQLANGFVPYSLSHLFAYNLDFDEEIIARADFLPSVNAVIPMIVTNASIFRLKPKITDLELIRQASSPNDIADEIEWTWCYFDPSMALFDQNMDAIEIHKKREAGLVYRFQYVEERMNDFNNRPNWIVIVNIKYLEKAARTIDTHFLSLETHTVKEVLKRRARKKSRRV